MISYFISLIFFFYKFIKLKVVWFKTVLDLENFYSLGGYVYGEEVHISRAWVNISRA